MILITPARDAALILTADQLVSIGLSFPGTATMPLISTVESSLCVCMYVVIAHGVNLNNIA